MQSYNISYQREAVNRIILLGREDPGYGAAAKELKSSRARLRASEPETDNIADTAFESGVWKVRLERFGGWPGREPTDEGFY